MGVFAVYNIHDSVEAKNLFARQSEDDIFSDFYKCTCVVHVEDAFLSEEYVNWGKLHKTELCIEGEVVEAFIEPHDDRIFPCGSKNLKLMTPQRTTIHWLPTCEEKGTLYRMGCDEDDFQLPKNLIGNNIEIPMIIKYVGIYESPVAAIEVMDAENILTCTKDNQYFGFFETCEPSKLVEAQSKVDYQMYPDKMADYYKETDIPDYAEEIMSEPNVTEELEAQTEEDVEDIRALESVNRLIEEQAAESEVRRSNRNDKGTKTILSMVNDKLAKAAREEEDRNADNVWDTMFDDVVTENKAIKHKPSYEDFKTAAAEFAEQEHVKAEEDAKKTQDEAKTVDRAMDNRLLNAGIDDISGYTSSSETKEQKLEKAKANSGKKSLDIVHQQDIAADNAAMNANPQADISGHGAQPVSSNQLESAQALVANLLGNDSNVIVKPEENAPQFL